MNPSDRSEVEHLVKQLSLGKVSPENFVAVVALLFLEEHVEEAINKAAWFALAAADCRMDLAVAESGVDSAEVTRCKRHVEMFDDMTNIMLGKL